METRHLMQLPRQPPAKKKRKTNAGMVAATVTRRTTRSQKPLLSIEMIAKVGSFADYDNGDLMNICVAVGPANAKIVRYVCLRNSMRYLQRNTRKRLSRRDKEKLKEDLSSWMEVNTDWRQLCSLERVNRDVFCSANFTEDGEAMAMTNPLILFNNPAVAIEFGRLDILKHLVEEIGIDINAQRWAGYSFFKKFHLLALAMLFNRSCFDYLLSLESTNVRAPCMVGVNQPTWELVFIAEENSASMFYELVQHPSFGPNRSYVDDDGIVKLPLHHACLTCIANYRREVKCHLVAKVKCLLEVGADPLLSTFSLPSSLKYVTNMRDALSLGENLEKVQICNRLIAMMEAKVAARST